MHGPDSAYPRAPFVARSFVTARLEARALAEFPDTLPPDLTSAYACQDAAISLWPDSLAGWKVGGIGPAWRAKFTDERLVGPVFRRAVRPALTGEIVELPMFVGGFAAVEAEFVLRLAANAPAGKLEWSVSEAAELVAALHVGVEPASSPLASLNELGPAAIVCDFGNNAGLVVGPEIPDWRSRDLASLTSETFLEGESVGRGSAASIAGGPLAALAFALACCARRGHSLKAGMHVTTGATTGIHQIRAGQAARVDFGAAGTILCRAIPAQPRQATGARLRPNLRAC
jgi:2-keto-4-pentenoate hydratase